MALGGFYRSLNCPLIRLGPKRRDFRFMLGDAVFCQPAAHGIGAVCQHVSQVLNGPAGVPAFGFEPRFRCGSSPCGRRQRWQAFEDPRDSRLGRASGFFCPITPFMELCGSHSQSGIYEALKVANLCFKSAFFLLKLSIFVFF